ncbi:MAG: DUF1963 domain-containing protein [Bacteroidales bacterium]|nr:DUF1963 domain-containing protein [Bacteroidales bacterium]MBR5054080.1 DUF1963 domain-containing protein [Bacteroidales bacterium]
MAIRLDLIEKKRNLFCESKFWGDPDMAPDMEYPLLDGRPLTFLCQVDCYDIAPLDPDGILPHEGMLYFFADIDDLLGYDTGVHHEPGEWPKGHALVKFTKAVNMETFKSVVQVDEDDEPLAQKAVALAFSACDGSFGGLRMLGDAPEGYVTLLQVPLDPQHTLRFEIKVSDLGFGNWKKARFLLVES